MRRLLKWLLIEARDWIFGIAGILGILLMPTIPFVVVFAALYIWAVYATSRWLKEDRESPRTSP